MKMFDIVFISFGELNAEENFCRIKSPNVFRIQNVSGISNAHHEAAKLARTEYLYIIDGDNELKDEFDFSFFPTLVERNSNTTFVWRAQNPINGLIYGNGGVKLLKRKTLLNLDEMKLDMTTHLCNNYKAISIVSSITRFNWSAESTWRSAFRECVKLSSGMLKGNKKQQESRLNVWLNVADESEPFWKECLLGAKDGVDYGTYFKDDLDELKKINDFNWLGTYYNGYRM